MDKLEVIRACFCLVEYSAMNGGTGADFDIDTPEGTVHFTYDFTIYLKNEKEKN